MFDINIYVIMHTEKNVPDIYGYKSILVGAALGNDAQKIDYKDNSGDNISYKNKSYCELTGMYWIWKNDNGAPVRCSQHR